MIFTKRYRSNGSFSQFMYYFLKSTIFISLLRLIFCIFNQSFLQSYKEITGFFNVEKLSEPKTSFVQSVFGLLSVFNISVFWKVLTATVRNFFKSWQLYIISMESTLTALLPQETDTTRDDSASF